MLSTKNKSRFMSVLVMLAMLFSFANVSPAAAKKPSPASVTMPGTVVGWGWNFYGQTSIPAGLSGVTAISAGYGHSLALKSDGMVVGWGNNSFGEADIPAGLSGVTAISAGYRQNLALKSDGTVVGWGWNGEGETDIPAGLSGVIAISAGGYHSLALKSDGTVVGWGWNGEGETDIPAGLNGVTAIAAGRYHSLALKSDGTVVGWGYNGYGQITIPAGLNGVTTISAGWRHSLALKSDGTVVGWGDNYFGQTDIPAGLSGVIAISAGDFHSLALMSDGTVVGWGVNNFGQTDVPAGLSGVTAIAAGGLHSLALVVSNDTTAPTIVITTPTDGATYLLNQSVIADYTCEDEADGSGLASCAGTVLNGSAIDTASVGSKSFTVNAADNAGNSNSVTVSYNVAYKFSGFFPPVANAPALNVANAGQNIPLKFRVTDSKGFPVKSLSSVEVTVTSLACSLGSTPNAPKEHTSGKSGLKYLGNGYYRFNWKTPKAYAHSCKTLNLDLGDGIEHIALFKFTR